VRVLEMSAGSVNTLGRPLRTALFIALARAEAEPEVRGVVLRGAGPGFSGGADIEEFDSIDALAQPSLDTSIAEAIEAMTTPVVAAIHGFADLSSRSSATTELQPTTRSSDFQRSR
jgi:3-hydroxyacyl-CoA dehydrogenase